MKSPLHYSICGRFVDQAAIAILKVAVYPLDGSPLMVASSDARLSEKTLSPAFDVGFDPLGA